MLRRGNLSPEAWAALCVPLNEVRLRNAHNELSSNHHVMGALFVGSWTASVDEEILSKNDIRQLVAVTDAPWAAMDDDQRLTQRHVYTIPLQDTASPPATTTLRDSLPRVCRFIDKQLHSGENVLVYCQQGISRSAAIVIAYLMFASSLVKGESGVIGYDEALAELRLYRPCAKPNDGFERTLRAYEQDLRDEASVDLSILFSHLR